MSYKSKIKTIGGREYRVIGSTTESERGHVVFQSFSVYGGKVIVEKGKVWHADGTITDIFGRPIGQEKP
jgi:hypothetical protein